MKLKINSKVVPSKKCLKFYKSVGLSIYEYASGELNSRHIPDICYWNAAQLGYLGTGKVVEVKDDFRARAGQIYLVRFKSKFGETKAWYDREDLEPTATYRKPKSE